MKRLPRWFGALFSTSKWAIFFFRGARTLALARMVFALFSSFWQCRNTDEKMGLTEWTNWDTTGTFSLTVLGFEQCI